MQDKNGADLVLAPGTVVSLFDVDKDGLADLFVGTVDGPVFFCRNLGGGRVDDPVKLKAGGSEIFALIGGPFVFDWDKDGTPDLFLGEDSGRLSYFHGIAKSMPPAFEKRTVILPPLTARELLYTPPSSASPLDWNLSRPGTRLKPFVYDWNGDGKLDLLVGDARQLEDANDKLTPDEKAQYDQLRPRFNELTVVLTDKIEAIKSLVFKKLGWTDEKVPTEAEDAKYAEEFEKLAAADPEIAKTESELTALFEKLQPLMPPLRYHGFVWTYLHK